MASACCSVDPAEAPVEQTTQCVQCGRQGKLIPRATLQSLLTIDLRLLHPGDYRLCATPACPVAYFAADGTHSITVDHVRVPIWQKHPAPTTPVCYCFKITPALIRDELIRTGTSTVVDDITAGIKAQQCACELTNPQGACCLGNVRAAVAQLAETFRAPAANEQQLSGAQAHSVEGKAMTTTGTFDLDGLAARMCTTSDLRANLSATVLRLLARGNPVSPAELAQASGQTLDQVTHWLELGTSIERDAQGRIIGAGLTLTPTPHQFIVDGRTLYTWCALDTLIFPLVLGQPAHVVSTTPETGELVQLTVTPEGVSELAPPTAVVSLVDACDADIRAAFCRHVHFFTTPAAATAWLGEHPSGLIVPVQDAFALAQRLAACLNEQDCCC